MLGSFLRWWDSRLSTLPPWLIQLGTLAIIAALIALDLLTTPGISLVLFYLLPIGVCAWYGGPRWAHAYVLLSGLALVNDLSLGPLLSPVPIWNALIRVGMLTVYIQILISLRDSLRRAEQLAKLDPLTQALNVRAFQERIARDQQRALRRQRPITLAYLDLDNFKAVNDMQGHSVGDQVLITMCAVVQSHLRAGDTLARVGGDEFVVVLSEVDAAAARAVIGRIQAAVAEAFDRAGWPVTMSIGVVTFSAIPYTVDEMLRVADAGMYRAKQLGKNMATYATYPEELALCSAGG